ncbi:hypothetical protein AIOL_003054 [Candidatus Rhodobacter oscarellae]|uniref:YjiS-like domain-containing protein n=1 Tax=Candidatus Rhodobacter oscarellae TaxID=1675527 RepID=A0A0J9E8R3_9RHOB|nr:DUF1127 domain-containing protein [Candidatus Rhodobacter lobularis]KMW58084.1 hypothetical protein AIOL_003054 [Candidatus Rhodobacter lobularis]
MAFVDELHRFESRLVNQMRNSFADLRRAAHRRKEIRATVAELSALSDRELSDLGIARGEIYAIAKQNGS